MSDNLCSNCQTPMQKRGEDNWVCPVCDDVTLYSEDQ